jgi:hypothetical protein
VNRRQVDARGYFAQLAGISLIGLDATLTDAQCAHHGRWDNPKLVTYCTRRISDEERLRRRLDNHSARAPIMLKSPWFRSLGG